MIPFSQRFIQIIDDGRTDAHLGKRDCGDDLREQAVDRMRFNSDKVDDDRL